MFYAPQFNNNNNSNSPLGNLIFQELAKDIENKKAEINKKHNQKNDELQMIENKHKNDYQKFKDSLDIEQSRESEIEKRNFIESQKIQNKQIQNLQEQITNFKINEQNYYRNSKNIKSFSSFTNPSRLISITPTNDKDFLIRLNNKCLTVNSTENYNLEPCSLNNPNQRFMNHTIYDVPSLMKVYPNINPVPESVEPFNIIYSKISGLCLTDENDGISLQECQNIFTDLKNIQKWKPETTSPRCQ